MTDIANNPNFPLQEAADWIHRWRTIGGGFYVRETEGEVTVQLARQTIERDGNPDAFEAECSAMEAQILADPRMKMAVMVLARDAWEKSQLRTMPAGGKPN